MILDKEELKARLIPAMTDLACRRKVREYAKNIERGSIVEVGAWMGACTSYAAMGLIDGKKNTKIDIHVYDQFKATRSEVEKAEGYALCLYKGEHTKYAFRNFMNPWWNRVNIITHIGSIANSSWIRKPIGLYLDDASKRKVNFSHAMRIFKPYFIPGKTYLFMMDYFYFEKRDDPEYLTQKEYFKKHKDEFQFVERISEDASLAIFLFKGKK